MAPELVDFFSVIVSRLQIRGERYNKTADVFSYGVFLWELLTQKEPYKDFENPWSVANFVTNGERLPIPDTTPPEYALLIESCWTHNPANRPQFAKIVTALSTYYKSLPPK